MMDGLGGHYWGMGWWWIIVLFIIVAIVWMALKTMNKKNINTSFGKTPLDILKERYARGEINKQEFEEKKSILGS